MSKIKLFKAVVDDIKALSESLEDLYYCLEAGETSNRILEKQVKASKENLENTGEISKNYLETSNGPVKEETKITLEEVRTVLAIKAQEGKQKEIKALINAYDATKLSEVDPKWYREILKQAGGL